MSLTADAIVFAIFPNICLRCPSLNPQCLECMWEVCIAFPIYHKTSSFGYVWRKNHFEWLAINANKTFSWFLKKYPIYTLYVADYWLYNFIPTSQYMKVIINWLCMFLFEYAKKACLYHHEARFSLVFFLIVQWQYTVPCDGMNFTSNTLMDSKGYYLSSQSKHTLRRGHFYTAPRPTMVFITNDKWGVKNKPVQGLLKSGEYLHYSYIGSRRMWHNKNAMQ